MYPYIIKCADQLSRLGFIPFKSRKNDRRVLKINE